MPAKARNPPFETFAVLIAMGCCRPFAAVQERPNERGESARKRTGARTRRLRPQMRPLVNRLLNKSNRAERAKKLALRLDAFLLGARNQSAI